MSRTSSARAPAAPGTPPVADAHLPALDGLRGIAVLLVMFCHFLEHQQRFSALSWRVLYGASDSAWCGVDLFFVLSGFLITGILYDSKEGAHYFRSFYMRRVLRIFPLYYGFLLVATVLVPWVTALVSGRATPIAHQGWLWFYGTNILMGLRQEWLFDQGPVWMGHLWSLAVEEQFYLVWPLIVFIFPRRPLMEICAVFAVAALTARVTLLAGGANELPAYVLTHCRVDSLAAGAFIALAARGKRGPDVLLGPAKLVAVASGAALLWLVRLERGRLAYDDWRTQTFGFSLLAVFFGALLTLAAFGPANAPWRRLCSVSLLRRFGQYSYALYLFHVPLTPLFQAIIPATMLAQWLHSYRIGLGLHVALSIALSLGLAVLSWNLFEKHFLKLKRYFPYEVRRSGPIAGAGASAPVGGESSPATIFRRTPLTPLPAAPLNPPARPNT
ncbi:MAG TPA: acyltransferase [Opitutaceae bacterium]